MSPNHVIIHKRELSWNGKPLVFYSYNKATNNDPVLDYENANHKKISLGRGDWEFRISAMNKRGYEEFCASFGGSQEFYVKLSKGDFQRFCKAIRPRSVLIAILKFKS